jgi:hypothetical protein
MGREYKIDVHVLDGIDEFGYQRRRHDIQTPSDTRKFVFRNGVMFEGTLAAPGGGAPAGSGSKLTISGMPAGADITYSFDNDANVELVPVEVDTNVVYFATDTDVTVGDDATVVYNEIEAPFDLQASEPNALIPAITFTWSRSSTPDEFGIIVDDELTSRVDGDDAFDSGTDYSWTWHGMQPHVLHDVQVRARIIGKGWSTVSNTVRVRYKPVGIHLIASDIGVYVPIYGQSQIQETLSRDGATFYLINRRDPVRINGKARGFYGQVQGQLVDDFNGSAGDHLRRLFLIMGLHSTSPHLRLVWGKQSYHVLIADLTYDQWPMAEVGSQAAFNISFNWWQTGDFDVPISGDGPHPTPPGDGSPQ